MREVKPESHSSDFAVERNLTIKVNWLLFNLVLGQEYLSSIAFQLSVSGRGRDDATALEFDDANCAELHYSHKVPFGLLLVDSGNSMSASSPLLLEE